LIAGQRPDDLRSFAQEFVQKAKQAVHH
jgi:hypothetical protein